MPLYTVKYVANGVEEEVVLKLPIDNKKIAKQHLMVDYNVQSPTILSMTQKIDMSAFDQINEAIGEDAILEDLPESMQEHLSDKFIQDNRTSFFEYLRIEQDKIILGIIIMLLVLYILFFNC